MSALHHTSVFRKYFYSRRHFPKILGGVMLASGVAGYCAMGYWHGQKMEERKQIYVDAYHNGGSGGSRLVSLARKMTHRFVSPSESRCQESPGLQRQVTKFW